MQEFVEIFSQKDRKTEEFSFSSPYVRGRRLKKFCLSVYLSFSNMPVAGYLTLVNEWYFFAKKFSKNLEIRKFCCIFAVSTTAKNTYSQDTVSKSMTANRQTIATLKSKNYDCTCSIVFREYWWKY